MRARPSSPAPFGVIFHGRWAFRDTAPARHAIALCWNFPPRTGSNDRMGRHATLLVTASLACTPAGSGPSESSGPGTSSGIEPLDTSGVASSTTQTTGDTVDPDGISTTIEPSTSFTSSDATATTSSTGEPIEPSVTVELVTDQNRHYAEMHGGWGPHLRAPMLDAAGNLWFAYDGGPSVLQNTTIHYARRTDAGWQTVASQPHTAGVQQNAAHVLRGDFIFTYAVNTTQHWLEECYFDTTNYAYAACNAIQIGGTYSTPANSNYVGAALGPAGETIVWFTVVGDAGGTGQLVYTYDYGGGWNGPVVTVLPGWNDIGYLRTSFRGPSQIAIIGQGYVGDYPTGEYTAGVTELTFGNVATLDALLPAPPSGQVRSGADIWVDPVSGDTHALAQLAGTLTYHHLPSDEAWADHLDPVATLDDLSIARLLHVDGGPLVLVGGGAAGLQARWADPGGPIDWTAAELLPITIPADGFDSPSGIHAMRPEYQTATVTGLHFAVCGQYQVSDEQIWHGLLEL